ncbi:hypothetical protein GGX14DRAFT_386117 [Mycena pura]|uniref:Uncharacterized protein n=1 Tax=Mycena pura TaxID=153505 RepID=A0AAD6YS95_9AGAR|nr:hypothetical protein GGX14DRAFT_386117 [Mycena pura]
MPDSPDYFSAFEEPDEAQINASPLQIPTDLPEISSTGLISPVPSLGMIRQSADQRASTSQVQSLVLQGGVVLQTLTRPSKQQLKQQKVVVDLKTQPNIIHIVVHM